MTIKLSSLKADLKREAEGDWIDFPDWVGVSFHVASPLAPAFATARDLKLQELSKRHKGKDIPTAEADAANADLYATYILKGWKGLDVEYTPDMGREICTKPEYRNVFNAIIWCSGRLSRIEEEFVEDETKNSSASSATT